MEEMNDFWSLNEGTFYCLYDQKRTLAFRKAIRNTVKNGDVVLELGAGSGILSMFAADAGAKKVYSVELDKTNLSSLKTSVMNNGYHDIIEVIEGDALTVAIPEKVDVVICELIATGLIEELQVPAMNNAQKYMKPNASVILKEYDVKLSLVNQKNTYYNKQFQINRFEFPDKTSLRSKILSDEVTVQKVDFSKKVTTNKISKKVKVGIKKPGEINGLRISSETIFSDKSTLDYSLAYSFPVILPVESQSVKKGDVFEISISYKMCEGPETLSYKVKKL